MIKRQNVLNGLSQSPDLRLTEPYYTCWRPDQRQRHPTTSTSWRWLQWSPGKVYEGRYKVSADVYVSHILFDFKCICPSPFWSPKLWAVWVKRATSPTLFLLYWRKRTQHLSGVSIVLLNLNMLKLRVWITNIYDLECMYDIYCIYKLLPFLSPSQAQPGTPTPGCRDLQSQESQPHRCRTRQRQRGPAPRRNVSSPCVSRRKRLSRITSRLLPYNEIYKWKMLHISTCQQIQYSPDNIIYIVIAVHTDSY